MAHGTSLRGLAGEFAVGHETVRRAIAICRRAVLKHTDQLLRYPTNDEWFEKANEFESLWQFPRAVAALDGKHVAIEVCNSSFAALPEALTCSLALFVLQKPKESGKLYRNYKGFFSIVLLAAVDAQLRFIYADVGGVGRVCDSELLRSSSLGLMLNCNADGIPGASQLGRFGELPYCILGDGGFALGPKLMKPFSMPRVGHLEHEKRVYNYRLSRYQCCYKVVDELNVTCSSLGPVGCPRMPSGISFTVFAFFAIHWWATCKHIKKR